jgi:flagellar hook protein FlgE
LQAGIGTQVVAISQQFSQGNISNTSNPLDLAINGNGFFVLEDAGSAVYSRNGQFQVDNEGYIVNNTGQNLVGIRTDGSEGAIQLNTGNSSPSASTTMEIALNLDSREAIPGVFAFAGTPPVASNYNHTTAMSVFDSLGNAHTITFYFAKTAPVPPATTPITWNVHGTVTNSAGTVTTLNAGNSLGTLTFDTSGALTTNTATTIAIPAADLGTGAAAIAITNLDFTGTTQYGSNFGVYSIAQNGYTTGQLAGLSIDDDGTIRGRYTNGQTQDLGRVALSNFANPQGLLSIGNNLWVETTASGQAITPQAPGSPGLGILQSGAVEESNVDLTAELVNLIVAQRLYQANAQTIRAQDQILQTLVNLR